MFYLLRSTFEVSPFRFPFRFSAGTEDETTMRKV